ncbi:MAG: hypothetical protein ACK4MX_02270 [Thermaurantiacus sp.]
MLLASAAVEAQEPPPEADPPIERRVPGIRADVEEPVPPTDNPGAVPPPEAWPRDHLPIPDRWRILDSLEAWKIPYFRDVLEVRRARALDPYNQNVLKGDKPLPGTTDWFLLLAGISDTVIEPRTFPIPVGIQTSERPDELDVFGASKSTVFAQTVLVSASLFQGSTLFKPVDQEFKVALAFQFNHVSVPERRVLRVQPSRGTDRPDAFVGVQELFYDYHIRNVSDRYDFDSIRFGIQPFTADFRGFLFQDNQLGVRLFGTRDDNRVQYNLGAFVRLEKDTNSGLNAILRSPRRDYVFVANLYRQDFPLPALTSQLVALWNVNREADDIQIDTNGFPVRPALIGNLRGRDYDAVYLGYNADGRIGRLNLTASGYLLLGEERNSVFTGERAKIRAFFLAAEPSIDSNWARFRGSLLFASGDGDPYDNTHRGYDAVFENPLFAGADTSYWIRQTIPFAGGGRVISVNGRNGILNTLRSSKEQGQSNFVNPGTILIGAGTDLDLTPTFRLSANANHLWFHRTAVLEALRQQGGIPNEIGFDLSAAAIWRPFMHQNIVVRGSAAVLIPGDGFRTLFVAEQRRTHFTSVLLNLVLSY